MDRRQLRKTPSGGCVDRKLNVLFSFLLVVIFITVANTVQQWHMVLGLILAAFFSFIAFLFRRLTLDGMFAAIVVGIVILGLGGWPAAAVVLLFFISSAAISGPWSIEASDLPDGIRRDGRQVWANGLWMVLSFIIAVILEEPLFIIGALGALATATADTWATEIGMRVGGRTHLITNFQKVNAGTDGGISVAGTAGAILGSATITAASIYVFSLQLDVFFAIFLAGFLGSVADSYFGAIFQRNNSSVTLPILQYQVYVENNIVNGISTGIGALLAIIFKLTVI